MVNLQAYIVGNYRLGKSGLDLAADLALYIHHGRDIELELDGGSQDEEDAPYIVSAKL
ncbi:heat shock protein sks2 [Moniliophthora roreri]|uniref:Uncharacterized protein n=1 Tax=Moniliophthora roreri TaxID=221103 RepID=A0A0W0FP70_MONRR|nr:heat shock protein sks2 [Moniliophthora roreri]